MEESKYYTPSIEEFHIGFEYEILGVNKINWFKCNYFDGEFIDYDGNSHLQEHIDQNNIRVKYLDKQDIEELGFKECKDNVYSIFIKEQNIKKCYLIIHENNEITLSFSETEFDYDCTIVSYIKIKNKSELKKLLKQLDII